MTHYHIIQLSGSVDGVTHSMTNRLIMTSDPNESYVGTTVSRSEVLICIYGYPVQSCRSNQSAVPQQCGQAPAALGHLALTKAGLTVCRAPRQRLEAKAGTLSLASVGRATFRARSSQFSGRDLELVPLPFGADGSHGTCYAPALLNMRPVHYCQSQSCTIWAYCWRGQLTRSSG